jgi:UbiD family decarboxylase
MDASVKDLHEWLDELAAAGELVEVTAPVSAVLEIPEIHRRVIATGGPALLFRNVEGADFPLVINLFGTPERVMRAFGRRPFELVEELAKLPEELMPPRLSTLWKHRGLLSSLARIGTSRRGRAPVCEVVQSPPRLTRLPATHSWPRDGGRVLTLPLVYTEHPETAVSNLGIYRMQIFDDERTGMHMQIGKGGGFHLSAAEELDRPLPVNIHLGGPPALMLAAVAPLPENVPEMLLASMLARQRLAVSKNPSGPLPVFSDAELVLVGELRPGERHAEGPFGDHYGYYSEQHDYPLFRCRALLHRKDAIFPATAVGKPRQEDYYLGNYVQELLAPLIRLVMPGVRDLWSYGETGFHCLTAAVVRERYKREAMVSAFRILGEGQLSLTKFLLALDRPVDLRDFRAVLTHVLERTDLRTDLFVLGNLSMDSLDYAGPRICEGGKGVLLGLGEPKRRLPTDFSGSPPPEVRNVEVFAPGCLVLDAEGAADDVELARAIARHAAFADWQLLVLCDDAKWAARSDINFLWTTFTRFDPAADLHASKAELQHSHPIFCAPLLIDARMKPGYPEELFCDEETAERVDRRWKEYFPRGLEMGNSALAHLSGPPA